MSCRTGCFGSLGEAPIAKLSDLGDVGGEELSRLMGCCLEETSRSLHPFLGIADGDPIGTSLEGKVSPEAEGIEDRFACEDLRLEAGYQGEAIVA